MQSLFQYPHFSVVHTVDDCADRHNLADSDNYNDTTNNNTNQNDIRHWRLL